MVYIRPQNLEENVKTLFDIFEEHKLNFHQDTWVELKEFDSGEILDLQNSLKIRFVRTLLTFKFKFLRAFCGTEFFDSDLIIYHSFLFYGFRHKTCVFVLIQEFF